MPAAGAIILRENKLLLVKRKYPPQKNMWCIPAGFMEFDETPEDCCIREIKEETGLDIRIKSTFKNYPGHDDPRAKVVLLIYKAEVIGGNPMAGDDAVDLDFFALDKIPTDIAFEAHKMAIADLRKSLENEIYFNDGIIHGG